MTLRTSTRIVTFARPFELAGFDEPQPAGSYSVETDEELVEGLSFPAHRRIATLMRLPALSGISGTVHTVPIDPAELEQALQRDREPAESAAIPCPVRQA